VASCVDPAAAGLLVWSLGAPSEARFATMPTEIARLETEIIVRSQMLVAE
jgi:hypothetical protein